MSVTRPIDLSVVVPVLNERENVERLLPRTVEVLRTIGCRYELVVVDGGSTDGTPEELPQPSIVIFMLMRVLPF